MNDTFGRIGHNDKQVKNPSNPEGSLRKPLYVKTIAEATPETEGPEAEGPETEGPETALKDKSVSVIASDFSNSITGILDDITNIKDSSSFINIMSKDDRLTHLGILFAVISVFILLIKNS